MNKKTLKNQSVVGFAALSVSLGAILSGCGSGLEQLATPLDAETSAIHLSGPLLRDAGVLVGTVGQPMAQYDFQKAGSDPTSCLVTPSLVQGLTLSPLCAISGTPQSTSGLKLYTVTASNKVGSSIARISIMVNDSIPVLQSIPPIAGFPLLPISPVILPNTGGAVTQCITVPNLPIGFSVTVANGSCRVSGTPTGVTSQTQYVVLGTNDSGYGQTTITLGADNTAPLLTDGLSLIT